MHAVAEVCARSAREKRMINTAMSTYRYKSRQTNIDSALTSRQKPGNFFGELNSLGGKVEPPREPRRLSTQKERIAESLKKN